MPSVLVSLPQLPQDRSSGAARSVRTSSEFLAAAGWRVLALGTTATEHPNESTSDGDPTEYLRAAGIQVRLEPPTRSFRRVWRYCHRGVDYRILDVGRKMPFEWPQDKQLNADFDGLYEEAIADRKPDVLYTFGGHPGDVVRLKRARAAGLKIVFALRNLSYMVPGFFDKVDAALVPSQFMVDRYRDKIGLRATALPAPLTVEEVFAPDREAIFFTMVNPSVEKGLFFMARLAEELGIRRADVPLLVIESRGTAGRLVMAGLAGGFDLRRFENLMFSPSVPMARDIFAPTRALLVPSVWEEPGARVAAEALLNGVPPLVSDRGGTAGICGEGAIVLPLPAELTTQTRVPVSAGAVKPWIEVIERLADDEAVYEAASRRALKAGRVFHPDALAPRYVRFFEEVLNR